MKKIIISAFLFFASVCLIVFLIFPKNDEFNFLNKSIEQKKIDIQNKENYIKDLEKIVQDIDARGSQFAKIDVATPSGVGVPAIFDFLQKTASQSGMILKDTKADFLASSGHGEGIKESGVSFSLEGTYSSFKNFLSVMENSARLFEITSLDFSSGKGEIFNFSIQSRVRSY
ncbi:MAG: hypothetical protein COX37_02965 [Candidatus Nealsonbacteria bacterium CG23_combo_of_CG06-09_8_20_14_all_39_17]|uniref:Type 4a pilus biogenesis protein PilO n=1 Tax=Candidatus Nealsonbacteria bacterium CG23_combo_of_CG06-09_8_20_14_all_39_17 TaxID=1974722 RepID=A0A2G9YTN8_9BACT|nr:MAG: hypothetical protein COX37_02965 [Candidatus Nealsonbacteria bacterium CG23_combo_of_CG06-09_8_20_14_all_39_17]